MGRLRWQFRRASQQFRTTNRPEDSQFADSITTVVTSIVVIHYECRAEALNTPTQNLYFQQLDSPQ